MRLKLRTYVRPCGNLFESSVCLTEPFLNAHSVAIWIVDIPLISHVRVLDHIIVGLICENVKSNFSSLFLNILDEDCNLHSSSDLSPDGGDSGLITKESVHSHTVLREGDLTFMS